LGSADTLEAVPPLPPQTRLHVVTGKGGTGKTTVAAALALALASGGRSVLLVEVEARQGLAQLFDVPPLPYEERSLAVAPGGGEVLGLAIDPEAALLEYLDMYYRLGRAGKALERFGVIDFATTIAPGLRDVLLTGKVYEAHSRRGRDKQPVYDAIVVDAPPTGRITRFLNVNAEVSGLARMGPIRNQADSVMRMMRSPGTAVHLVTVLEEMPVQETVDGITGLRSADLPVGRVIVNLAQQSPLEEHDRALISAGLLEESAVSRVLSSVGLPAATSVTAGLLTEGREHIERLALQERQREVLSGLDQPPVELPRLAGGVDLGGLYDLAEVLCAEGVA
jgi:anion-transporting  ArsA/GET3 family ATPase